MAARRKTAVLISGRGSNMQALLNAAEASDFPAEITLVLSNRPDAAGLEIAQAAGVETLVHDHQGWDDRAAYDMALHELLENHQIDLVCHAGFMRILSAEMVDRWNGRMLNIHPSLLPMLKGLHTHERALDLGIRIHGCTVHFVTPQLDDGPIILQAAVPVAPADDAESLGARVLAAEHLCYPRALEMVASGQARMLGERVIYKNAESQLGQLFSPALPG